MGDGLFSVERDTPDRQLSGNAVARAAKDAGFTGDDLVTAIAVAKAESGWKNRRSAGANSNGTYDWGVWQINDVHKPSQSAKTEEAANAKVAYTVFKSQGWKAWSAYNNGAYKAFMPEAATAVKGTTDAPTGVTVKVDPNGPLNDIPNAIGGFASSVSKAVNTLASNAALMLLALVLLVVGVALLMRKPVGQTLGTVLPVGKLAKAVTR